MIAVGANLFVPKLPTSSGSSQSQPNFISPAVEQTLVQEGTTIENTTPIPPLVGTDDDDDDDDGDDDD
jgi:hypothetical protein